MSGTEHFDQAAATWDLADRRVTLARDVVAAIAAWVTLSKEQAALDFGCGTGLVTLALAPLLGVPQRFCHQPQIDQFSQD